MYEDRCPHGYVPSSCAECRAAVSAGPGDRGYQLIDHYRSQHAGKTRAELDAARGRCITRTAELEGYTRRSQVQADELDTLIAEQIVIDDLIKQDDVEVRRSAISRATGLMKDPANLEGPGSGSQPYGAPALVKGLGDRPESPGEVLQRMRTNPWRHQDGLLNRAETADGLIARCHAALEGMEPALTREGCAKVADAFAESSSWGGITVKRSKDEQAQAADLFLCLSDPHYGSALRQALRYPGEFYGAGGVGFETLSPEEREAWRRVRTNDACRAAFNEASGAGGAFAISLDLHPDIILSNAGSANPFRKLARNVISTTNVAEFVVSAGTTANWLAEGTAVTDTTPTLSQLAVTHYKESVWLYGSFELWQDAPSLNQQVPALIADAKDRLEVVAFALGSGSGQPFGLLVHGTSDATTGSLTAAMVYALHAALPPRFRASDTARPVWLGNVTIIDALRQIPSFTGSVTSLVNDNQADSIPEVLSIDIMECSSMASAQTVGNKTLALADMSQFIITSRQPELLIHEPLVKATASGFPTGQSGWFSWSRTGADLAVATACQYHTN
jgi:HK97 family phage major capsid protein